MSHECEYCGMMCDCDMDDTEMSQPNNCIHILRPVESGCFDDDEEEYWEDPLDETPEGAA